MDAKEPTNYAIFTVDVIQKGRTVKLNHDALLFMRDKGFNIVPILFDKVFHSEQELINECENILKLHKYEGIVIRNPENTFSCKYMSNLYDSLK